MDNFLLSRSAPSPASVEPRLGEFLAVILDTGEPGRMSFLVSHSSRDRAFVRHADQGDRVIINSQFTLMVIE